MAFRALFWRQEADSLAQNGRIFVDQDVPFQFNFDQKLIKTAFFFAYVQNALFRLMWPYAIFELILIPFLESSLYLQRLRHMENCSKVLLGTAWVMVLLNVAPK